MTKEDNKKYEEVSLELQKLLESNKVALQPFLSFSEFGIVPRVRLVDIPEQTNEESTNDEGEYSEDAGGSEGQSEPADSEQS